MRRRRSVLVGIVAAAGLAGATGAAAGGRAHDGSGAAGADADRAVAAALALIGGGRAGAVERDTELGATWEVEVIRPDGATVDVRLGADYGVVRIAEDRDRAAK